METFVKAWGPPADYQALKTNLIDADHADAYLKAIKKPVFTPFRPRIPAPPTTPARILPQGTPMDVDRQQQPGTSTRPQVAFKGNCYNCGQSGHPARNCSTPRPRRHGVHVAPPNSEASLLKEQIKQMQRALAVHERAAKGKANEMEPVQLLPPSSSEYDAD